MSLTLYSDPYDIFKEWFQMAEKNEPVDPNAMTLATCSRTGRPSARTVLLKSWDSGGFTFFTNYNSRKAQDITENPQAALLFYWKSLGRQVRIEGRVEKLPPAQSDEYFAGRPENSQLGAWASQQSEHLESREALLAKMAEYKNQFSGRTIPRPPHWGGYILKPDHFEFWQAGDARLHDRFSFDMQNNADWHGQRLNP